MGTEKVSCQTCDLAELCIPLGLDKEEIDSLDAVIQKNKKIGKKSRIYSNGEACTALYAVRSGSVKTVVVTSDGREQVTGFFLPGEIFGMDGVASNRYQCDAVTLEDSSFCLLSMDNLDRLSGSLMGLRQRIMTLMGRQITAGQDMMVLLGSSNAAERISAFLLSLTIRNQRYGFSETDIQLSMSREDIANFLGLTIETVSRVFAGLRQEGLISYKGRMLHVDNIEGMKDRVRMCSGHAVPSDCRNPKKQPRSSR